MMNQDTPHDQDIFEDFISSARDFTGKVLSGEYGRLLHFSTLGLLGLDTALPVAHEELRRPVSELLNLPDLPYAETGFLLQAGHALYKTGKTFHDLVDSPEFDGNVGKVLTSCAFLEPTLPTIFTAALTMTLASVPFFGLASPLLSPVLAYSVARAVEPVIQEAVKLAFGCSDLPAQIADMPVIGTILEQFGITKESLSPPSSSEEATHNPDCPSWCAKVSSQSSREQPSLQDTARAMGWQHLLSPAQESPASSWHERLASQTGGSRLSIS